VDMESTEDSWTAMDGPTPAGGDVAFAYGTFKGRTFAWVLTNFPKQFLEHSRKASTRSMENSAFVEWVTNYYFVDANNAHVRRENTNTSNEPSSSSIPSELCTHSNVRHGDRPPKTTCKECAKVWDVERCEAT